MLLPGHHGQSVAMHALIVYIRRAIFSCSTFCHFFSLVLITQMTSGDSIVSALNRWAREGIDKMGGSVGHALERLLNLPKFSFVQYFKNVAIRLN